MQRFPNIITNLCKSTKFTPEILSRRSFTTEIRDNNESVNNKQEGDNDNNQTRKTVNRSGFAKAFEKFNQPEAVPEPEKPKTFANLLRYSKFIDLGDPEGKIVTGRIFRVVDNDLYIDFGWKFHCVCTRPYKNGRLYVRGASVKLMIKDLELSTKFLGASKDLTILEADCTLMGIIHSPMDNVKSSV